MVPLPAFRGAAERPPLLVTSQHGAPWCVATAGLIGEIAPSFATSYDDAPPDASETRRLPRLSKSKPNGVAPADGAVLGGPAVPGSTTYVSIVCEAFSVTASTLPSGENATSAGPAVPAPSGRVEPA